MLTNWQVSRYELQNGDQRVNVEVDPSLDDNTLRVASLAAFQRLMGDTPAPYSNGNGGSTLPPAVRRRGSKRGTAVLSAPTTKGVGRANEWNFLTPEQFDKLRLAVESGDPHLTDLERQVLDARFLRDDPKPTAGQLVADLGLKHNSDVTVLTRRGLRALGIRVPRLRQHKSTRRGKR